MACPSKPATTQCPSTPAATQCPSTPAVTQCPSKPATTQCPSKPAGSQCPCTPADTNPKTGETNVTYVIHFNSNGGSESGTPSPQVKTYDRAINLSIARPYRQGYIFMGWSACSTSSSASYQPGSSYTSNASVILYAVWKTIVFLTNSLDLYINEMYYIYDILLPDDIDYLNIKFESSNTNVISISNIGFIEALNTGTSKITIKGLNDSLIYCNVTVHGFTSLSPFIVNNVKEPPRYFPNGEPITANNKENYYDGENYTARYFLDYVWPIQQNYEPENVGWHLCYVAWAKEVYGASDLQSFWLAGDQFLLGAADAVISVFDGVWTIVSNPKGVIDGFGLIIKGIAYPDSEERKLINKLIKDTLDQCWNDFMGTAEQRARLIGRIIGEILVALLISKGTSVVVNKLKDTKLFTRLMSKVATGELKADEALRCLEVIDDTSKFKPQYLIDELVKSGEKYTLKDILAIAKTPYGKLVWLEVGHIGTKGCGFVHVLSHATEFIRKGIDELDIIEFIMKAVSEGKIVGYQGAGLGRPIFELTFKGKLQRVAITISDNGFIIGANMKSIL